ncbi:hypothetical protein ABEY43_06815 [Priestia megaterium]
MYFIEWVDETGKKKSIVADAWITELSIMDDLKEKGFEPTSKLVEEVLAETI